MDGQRFRPFVPFSIYVFFILLSFGGSLAGKIHILSPGDLSTVIQGGANDVDTKIDKSIYIEFRVPSALFNRKLQLSIGSYDPVVFVHPCIDMLGCYYNPINSTIKIFINSIYVGK